MIRLLVTIILGKGHGLYQLLFPNNAEDTVLPVTAERQEPTPQKDPWTCYCSHKCQLTHRGVPACKMWLLDEVDEANKQGDFE